MNKIIILASLVAVTMAGFIDHHHQEHHEEHHHELPSETDHHHKVEHEHATSHQSFKIHHFHAVPVYVKKEDQQFLKHPVEISGVKHNLKIIHPETEHHHGHGLTLENHQEVDDKTLGHHSYEHGHDHSESHHDFSGHDFGHHHYDHESH